MSGYFILLLALLIPALCIAFVEFLMWAGGKY